MNRITILSIGCCILFGFRMWGQTSVSQLQKQADHYFESGEYRPALILYRQGGLENAKQKEVRFRIGRCLYEVNDVDGALRLYQSVIAEGKTDPVVFFHTARAYQSKLAFNDAVVYYKRFLQKCKADDPLRAFVKEELIRCSNGMRIRHGEEKAYVENAGTSINTQFSEFGVRTSPTTIDKIYFNSDRDHPGAGTLIRRDVDIYTAALVNGRWTTPETLPSRINTNGYDEVCGFSNDGQILYYLTPSSNSFMIRTDTFTAEENTYHQGILRVPFQPGVSGMDLFFFNDTICLFSSNQPGGVGGFDLYISFLRDEVWSAPFNLGPVINSPHDERCPFLTRDGLTLFFASNGLGSIGGYDIFTTVFDPQKTTWTSPQNMGIPVNSSLDDLYMVMSPDGMSAYLSSDRKEGYGEEDIYRVFFRQPLHAHQVISAVPCFYHHLALLGEDAMTTAQATTNPVEIKEYFVSHLFFDGNADILTPQNIKKLDLLVNLMMIYPRVTAELSCFELPTGQRTFNLYFSIKKAEKAAAYLTGKGIDRQRILLKGYGASFPLVAPSTGQAHNPLYQKWNQRLEITLHRIEQEPVIIHMEHMAVPDNLKDPDGVSFQALRNGMYYGVQIASISQILQNPDLETSTDIYIDVDNSQGNYRYMSGMVSTYQEAEQIRLRMVELGFTEATVIPYIKGIRINRTDVPDLSEKYPDLLAYLNGTRK